MLRARQYQPTIRFLRHRGFERCYEFAYWERYGRAPIAQLAEQLHDYVRTNITEPRIDCVAISQGGIIARWYIQHYEDQKIRRCVTLCTPHHGSWLVYLLPWPGARDLRPKSQRLRQLHNANDRTAYYCVWTPFDLMVVPGWSARLGSAIRNCRVWSLVHPIALRSRATLRFLHACLTDTSILPPNESRAILPSPT